MVIVDPMRFRWMIDRNGQINEAIRLINNSSVIMVEDVIHTQRSITDRYSMLEDMLIIRNEINRRSEYLCNVMLCNY